MFILLKIYTSYHVNTYVLVGYFGRPLKSLSTAVFDNEMYFAKKHHEELEK